MQNESAHLIIQPIDVLHALRKWDGKDYVHEMGIQKERSWRSTDREFLNGFSSGKISESLLSRFAAKNNNNNAS